MNLKILFFLTIFSTSNLFGQTLLKNIEDLLDNGSSPKNWSAVTNDLFIFEATNIIQGHHLFASDGSESGTIGLGTYQVDTDIIRFGNHAFFGGCNLLTSADSCSSLYVSDGTVEGTKFFFDLDPGGLALGIEDIDVGDSLFFFSGHTIQSGVELWRSNGTVEGTYRIDDIAPGITSGYIGELAVIDDIAYFAGYTDEFGVEAWRSDGTKEGTFMIVNLNEGNHSSHPSGFTKSGNYIYFSGLGTDSGFEVRRTNGTKGNIETIGEKGGSTDSSNPREFVDSDGRLYYVAEGEDAAGYDLFVYDHVGDPLHLEFPSGDIFPRALMPFRDGEVIFNAKDETGRELWISDGTLVGTHKIIDLYPGINDGVFGTGLVNKSFYVCHDSLVYFAGADGKNAVGEFVYELFVTDGTEVGTKLVSDHFAGPEGSNPGHFFEFKDRLYFAATDPVLGREPFYIQKENSNSVINDVNKHVTVDFVYPNPLPNGMMLNIELSLLEGDDLHVQLFDMIGKAVQKKINLGYLAKGNHHIQIPIDHQLSGVYLLNIYSKNDAFEILVSLE